MKPTKTLHAEKRKQPGHLDKSTDSRYDVFKCELTHYYRQHAPENLHKVENLANKYYSNVDANWKLIEKKYGHPRPKKSYCRPGDFETTREL
jgi:hypothetical protein